MNQHAMDNPLARFLPAEAEVRDLCEEFMLGALVKIHGDLGGSFNVNLKIETGRGFYILRIHSALGDVEHLRYQEGSLEITAGLPAARPLASARGEKYTLYRGRIVQALPFIEGKRFAADPVREVSRQLDKQEQTIDEMLSRDGARTVRKLLG